MQTNDNGIDETFDAVLPPLLAASAARKGDDGDLGHLFCVANDLSPSGLTAVLHFALAVVYREADEGGSGMDESEVIERLHRALGTLSRQDADGTA